MKKQRLPARRAYLIFGTAALAIAFAYSYLDSDMSPDSAGTDDSAAQYAHMEHPPDGAAIHGRITGIIDGDTLEIDGTRIRLALVDAPERGDAGYREAAEFAREECPVDSAAMYDVDDGQKEGSYGRIIAKVWCFKNSDVAPAESLNSRLVGLGHAEIIPHFCKTSEYGGEKWASGRC